VTSVSLWQVCCPYLIFLSARAVKCSHCNTDLVQKSRAALLLAGAFFLAGAIALFYLYAIIWIAALLLLVVAIYLLTWCILGKGLWCRSCKKFPVVRRPTLP